MIFPFNAFGNTKLVDEGGPFMDFIDPHFEIG